MRQQTAICAIRLASPEQLKAQSCSIQQPVNYQRPLIFQQCIGQKGISNDVELIPFQTLLWEEHVPVYLDVCQCPCTAHTADYNGQCKTRRQSI